MLIIPPLWLSEWSLIVREQRWKGIAIAAVMQRQWKVVLKMVFNLFVCGGCGGVGVRGIAGGGLG